MTAMHRHHTQDSATISLLNAKQVVFMGFGFHRQNIGSPLAPLKQETEIYSSDKDKDIQVQAMAAERLGRNPVWKLTSGGCLGLLGR